MSSVYPILESTLEPYVEAYERGWSLNRKHQLTDFLPPKTHPDYLTVVAEVIRVDLELSWAAGERTTFATYGLFAEVLGNCPDLQAEVIFEEYRQRTSLGESIDATEFAQQHGIDVGRFSTLVRRLDATEATAEFDTTNLPQAGQQWREFELVAEIGRGAMSRVFLARQTTLSQRQVVLKFAPKTFFEGEKLALLRHPNIVPVYSVHTEINLHVFCMPYLGTKTLEVWLGQKGGSATESDVLRCSLRLTEAIEHAHDRGILHNDIKPANVLIDEFEEPQLLDFNLSVGLQEERAATVGGTLAYMSPEALRGFTNGELQADKRSDLFSLAAVIYEMLNGDSLFPRHTETEERTTHEYAIAREAGPSVQQQLDTLTVTPGTKSILAKCLAAHPADRYQSAGDLAQDLRCQLEHRPLRTASNTSLTERLSKWCRRHPRIASFASLGTILLIIGVCIACAWLARGRHMAALEGARQFANLQDDANRILPALSAIGLGADEVRETIQEAERLLGRYITSDGSWTGTTNLTLLPAKDGVRAKETVAKLTLLVAMGYDSLAKQFHDEGSSEGDEKLEVERAAERWDAVSRKLLPRSFAVEDVSVNRLAKRTPDGDADASSNDRLTAEQQHILALAYRQQGQLIQAKQRLESCVALSSRDVSKRFDLAMVCQQMEQWSEAETHLNTCLALESDVPVAWFARGTVRQSRKKFQQAIEDYDRFLPAAKDPTYCLLQRALAWKQLGEYEKALQDLTAAIDAGFDTPRAFIVRSRVHKSLGNHLASLQDLQKAFKATPREELDYVSRGVARMARFPAKAADDFRVALTINPRSYAARRNLAYVLSEKLEQPDEALTLLDQLLLEHPNDLQLIGGRGVILARAGRISPAINVAQRVSQGGGSARDLLRAASIYAIAADTDSQWSDEALSLLGQSLGQDVSLGKLVRMDPDFKAIRAFEEFKSLCDAAALLSN